MNNNLIKNGNSISGAYQGLNTTFENFLILVKSKSTFVKSFQAASKKSLKSDLKSICVKKPLIGNLDTINVEKNKFIKMVQSTINIDFTKSEKNFLLDIVSQFYEIQEIELNLDN